MPIGEEKAKMPEKTTGFAFPATIYGWLDDSEIEVLGLVREVRFLLLS